MAVTNPAGAPRPWTRAQVVAIAAQYYGKGVAPEDAAERMGITVEYVKNMYGHIAWTQGKDASEV